MYVPFVISYQERSDKGVEGIPRTPASGVNHYKWIWRAADPVLDAYMMLRNAIGWSLRQLHECVQKMTLELAIIVKVGYIISGGAGG